MKEKDKTVGGDQKHDKVDRILAFENEKTKYKKKLYVSTEEIR